MRNETKPSEVQLYREEKSGEIETLKQAAKRQPDKSGNEKARGVEEEFLTGSDCVKRERAVEMRKLQRRYFDFDWKVLWITKQTDQIEEGDLDQSCERDEISQRDQKR